MRPKEKGHLDFHRGNAALFATKGEVSRVGHDFFPLSELTVPQCREERQGSRKSQIFENSVNLRKPQTESCALRVRPVLQSKQQENFAMSRTQHFKQYTDNAAAEIIRQYLVASADAEGYTENLEPEACRALLKQLLQIKSALETVRRRGGVIVVSQELRLITAYRYGSMKYRYQDPATNCRKLTANERQFLRNGTW